MISKKKNSNFHLTWNTEIQSLVLFSVSILSLKDIVYRKTRQPVKNALRATICQTFEQKEDNSANVLP